MSYDPRWKPEETKKGGKPAAPAPSDNDGIPHAVITHAESPYWMAGNEGILLVNATEGPVVITLCDAPLFEGRCLGIKRIDSGPDLAASSPERWVRVVGHEFQRIDQVGQRRVDPLEALTLFSDGQSWHVI